MSGLQAGKPQPVRHEINHLQRLATVGSVIPCHNSDTADFDWAKVGTDLPAEETRGSKERHPVEVFGGLRAAGGRFTVKDRPLPPSWMTKASLYIDR